jgi:hypothetical protein
VARGTSLRFFSHRDNTNLLEVLYKDNFGY